MREVKKGYFERVILIWILNDYEADSMQRPQESIPEKNKKHMLDPKMGRSWYVWRTKGQATCVALWQQMGEQFWKCSDINDEGFRLWSRIWTF